MEEVWSQRLSSAQFATLPGGHFFPDQFPEETAARLLTFIEGNV
jgi:haloacetate dehalogenase